MSRTKGALNTIAPPDTERKGMRLPADIVAWIETHEGVNFTDKVIKVLEAAKAREAKAREAKKKS